MFDEIESILPGYNDTMTNMTTMNTNITEYCTKNLNHVNLILTKQRQNVQLYDRYTCFVWFIIGFPGNFLSFFVWIRRKMRPSSGCYLAALAFNDFIFLLANIINKINYAWEKGILNVPIFCEIFPIVFITTQYLSLFFVLAFTVERYISVCHPYQREKYCTMHRAVAVIIGLTIFTLILHSLQAYYWYFDSEKNVCSTREAFDMTTFWSVHTWIWEITTFALVPCIIIIINIRVIVEIKRVSRRVPGYMAPQKTIHSNSQSKHTTSTALGSTSSYNNNNNNDTMSPRQVNTKSSTSTSAQSKFQKNVNSPGPQSNVTGTSQSATTLMLLAVSFFYIISTLPVTISYVTHPNISVCRIEEEIATDDGWQAVLDYWTARVIVQELGSSHYACNIIFYLLTGNLFRAELKLFLNNLFCRPSLKTFFGRKNNNNRKKTKGKSDWSSQHNNNEVDDKHNNRNVCPDVCTLKSLSNNEKKNLNLRPSNVTSTSIRNSTNSQISTQTNDQSNVRNNVENYPDIDADVNLTHYKNKHALENDDDDHVLYEGNILNNVSENNKFENVIDVDDSALVEIVPLNNNSPEKK